MPAMIVKTPRRGRGRIDSAVSPGDQFRTVSASRSLSVRLAASLCREESYLGVSHLVVPVIPILGNLVFWPMGAEGYEFVPEYVVASAPVGWNNRPVIPVHPDISQPTANTPAFLQANAFGQLFNTTYGSDGKLHTEAWLNRIRAAEVGELALNVIRDCEAGLMVEVSIGAQIAFESRAGEYNGRSYVGIWRGLVPDHLAMGLAGSEGACSIVTGCGGNRLAVVEANKPGRVASASADHNRKSIYVSNSNPLIISSSSSLARRAKGAQPVVANIKELVSSLLSSIRLSGTPAEDAEEAAELISYGTMRDLISSAITQLQSAQTEVLALISAETESPTETPESESAEETIEIAQFGRIKSLLYASADTIYSAANIVYDLSRSHIEAKELEEVADSGATPVIIVGDARYYTSGASSNAASLDPGSRSAKGARHSKADIKMIQSTHDMTVKLGAACADGEGGSTKTATAATAATAAGANANADAVTATTSKPCGCHAPAAPAPASLF